MEIRPHNSHGKTEFFQPPPCPFKCFSSRFLGFHRIYLHLSYFIQLSVKQCFASLPLFVLSLSLGKYYILNTSVYRM